MDKVKDYEFSIRMKIDFKALKAQKNKLVKLLWNEPEDTLWGLVNMIDYIQDEAEKIFGEDVVYPTRKRSK